ncbi:MAG: beta-hydroxyacyl-ACP dehydratase, partial [Planctomycetes bacterium]|nr:beta-hydroxyacyl-ACP dehydratase [Planctomycetota bacterium]
MAATPFVDLATIDLTRVVADREEIYRLLPHRHEFAQLDAIVWVDPATFTAVARRDVRTDEFWVRGHIPGRPLLPGVLMIETAAQLASYLTGSFGITKGFVGFARVDNVSFRGTVT